MYCDYAATTPLSDGMKKYLFEIMDEFGNPSSRYSLGDESRQIVELTRQSVRKFINAPDDCEVVFTPSGSASNTLAVKGFFDNDFYSDRYGLVYSPLLHKSLNKIAKFGDKHEIFAIERVHVFENGKIILKDLEGSCKDVRNFGNRPFVMVEYANSEIGTIQDIAEIAEIVHKYYGILYVDCTGAISSIPIDMKKLAVDMLGFSAHKLGALKGCGVLCYKKNIELVPLVFGAQENGLVGGTENVLGIASLGYAIQTYEYKNFDEAMRRVILKRIDDYGWKLAGDRDDRLPNSFYFSIPGANAEKLVTKLDIYKGIQCSTGSACSSGSKKPSSALEAIRVLTKDIFSYIRLSFHGDEKLDDVLAVLDTINEVANEKM